MSRTVRIGRLPLALLAAVVVTGVLASVALAYGTHTNNDLISSGATHWGGPYENAVYWVNAQSAGSAYAGTFVVNSSGVRVSADAYCNSPGCVATYNWGGGPYPNGYGAAHNHGNQSPSRFYGYISGDNSP